MRTDEKAARVSDKDRKEHTTFTPELKAKYLDLLRNDPDLGGMKWLCAEAVGVSFWTVRAHWKKDPKFLSDFQEALDAWTDENLYKPALKRARQGFERPIIGGQFKDTVVAHETVYSDSLMHAFLKSRRAEFREARGNASGDEAGEAGGARGGVVVLPAAPLNIKDWQTTMGDLAKGQTGRTPPTDTSGGV